MFKKINVVLMLLVLGSVAQAQKQFVVKGQLAKDKNGLIRFSYYTKGKTQTDSMQMKNGAFEFRGKIDVPTAATLEINPLNRRVTYEERMRQDFRDFYLENREIIIKSDSGLKSAIITAGKQQKYFEESEATEVLITKQMWLLNELGQRYSQEGNLQGLDSLRKRSVEINKNKDQLDSAFIAHHPDSHVAFQKLKLAEMLTKYDPATTEKLFLSFVPEIRSSEDGKILARKLKVAKTLKKGMSAPEINLPDGNGKLVSLSSMKGKYVLLCFSTQPDTRNLANLFNQLSGRNFSIYSVTFTNSMDFWNSLPHKETAGWTSVVDLNKIDSPTGTLISPTAEAYNLSFGFNNCFLLDPEGQILLEKMWIDPSLVSKIQNAIK